jgi:hypothetical protein
MSPLFFHLSPGAVITKLDDIPLNAVGERSDDDLWTQYLMNNTLTNLPLETQGWCINYTWFTGKLNDSRTLLFSLS